MQLSVNKWNKYTSRFAVLLMHCPPSSFLAMRLHCTFFPPPSWKAALHSTVGLLCTFYILTCQWVKTRTNWVCPLPGTAFQCFQCERWWCIRPPFSLFHTFLNSFYFLSNVSVTLFIHAIYNSVCSLFGALTLELAVCIAFEVSALLSLSNTLHIAASFSLPTSDCVPVCGMLLTHVRRN